MSRYFKTFESHNDYDDFVDNSLVVPNVSYCIEETDVHYNPIPNPQLDVQMVELSRTPQNGYSTNNAIHTKIRLKNNGNIDITNLTITVPSGVVLTQQGISELSVGQEMTIMASQLVTESMILESGGDEIDVDFDFNCTAGDDTIFITETMSYPIE